MPANTGRSHRRFDRALRDLHFPVAKERGLDIAAAFFAAARNGDMGQLRSLLATDVIVHSDGGGKVRAALRPIAGIEGVMKVHTALARVFAQDRSRLVRYRFINGLPGFVTIEAGETLQTTALEIEKGRNVGIYVVRDPDKLRHLGGEVVH